MRRFLAVLAVLAGASGAVLGGAVTAPAAVAAPTRSCPAPLPLPVAVKDADAVFTGTVTGRTVRGDEIRYEVDVQRSYSGRFDEQQTVVTARSPRGCGVPDLQRGGDYLFVATREGTTLRVSSRSGTAAATGRLVRRVQGLLGPGEGPVPTQPVRATFTPVAGPATPLARLVAPGLALGLLGLLGLLAGVALSRRPA